MIVALRAVSMLLIVPSALVIALNWLSFVGWAIRSRRGGTGGLSFGLPVLCGIACAIGCLICPWDDVRRWAWVPLLLDPSIALALVFLSIYAIGAGGRKLQLRGDRRD